MAIDRFAKPALLIVDMQNDFVRVGAPMEVPQARDTISQHQQLIQHFREVSAADRLHAVSGGPEPQTALGVLAEARAANPGLPCRTQALLCRRPQDFGMYRDH